LPEGQCWPIGTEIDIVEYYVGEGHYQHSRTENPAQMSSSYHYGYAHACFHASRHSHAKRCHIASRALHGAAWHCRCCCRRCAYTWHSLGNLCVLLHFDSAVPLMRAHAIRASFFLSLSTGFSCA
jgi:hypothetical protein